MNDPRYEPETLKDRLRGVYRITITDGLGAVGGGDEPDNPHEFVRSFPSPPIQHEAARRIEELEKQLSDAGWQINADRQGGL